MTQLQSYSRFYPYEHFDQVWWILGYTCGLKGIQKAFLKSDKVTCILTHAIQLQPYPRCHADKRLATFGAYICVHNAFSRICLRHLLLIPREERTNSSKIMQAHTCILIRFSEDWGTNVPSSLFAVFFYQTNELLCYTVTNSSQLYTDKLLTNSQWRLRHTFRV